MIAETGMKLWWLVKFVQSCSDQAESALIDAIVQLPGRTEHQMCVNAQL